MTPRVEALAALRATGHRITPQRQMVLEVVESSAEHLDAETIHQRARERANNPRISLATVYRTLSVLKDMGLIEQRYLSRDHTREHYEPTGAQEHYHFTCLGCREVIEFQSPKVKRLAVELNRELGVEVAHACICLEGYCQMCAARSRRGRKR